MRSTYLFAASVAALAVSLPAFAQSSPPRRAADDTILVEGRPFADLSAADLSPASTVTLSGAELDRAKAASLGETLQRLPGIQNSYFGPAAGRPEIRGQSGPRVALLANGLAAQDMSAIAGNHAAPIEPFLADRIEVLKGPASILYGGSAIGGAVNVIDGRIAEALPERPIAGRAEVRMGINSGVATLARVDGSAGRFAWHVDGAHRYASDFDIPAMGKASQCRSWGSLVSDLALRTTCQVKLGPITYVRDPATGRYVDATPVDKQKITDLAVQPTGRLPNSGFRTTSVAAGGSYIGDRGFIGVSVSRFDSRYGVPGFDYITSAHPNPSPIALVTGQTRIDLKAGIERPLPGIASITLRAARTLAEDRERIDGADSSRLRTRAEDARIEIAHLPLGPLEGVAGGQFTDRALSGGGKAAWIPGVDTHERSLFLLERLKLAPLTVQGGIRRDWVRHDLDEASLIPGRGLGSAYAKDRRFDLWNYAVSGRLALWAGIHLDARYAHAERAPAVNELYASANHFAILVEEQGDGRLRKERSENLEGGIGFDSRLLSLSGTVYRADYRNFLYLGNTGISRTLPVSEWRQGDTRFTGFEGDATLRLPQFGIGAWQIHGFVDQITGKPRFSLPEGYSPFAAGATAELDRQYYRQRLDGDYLPRTPVSRFGGDVQWTLGALTASVGAIRFQRQEDVARNEAVSPGYTLVDAHIAYGLQMGTTRLEAFVDATNVGDADVRLHNSFLRYRAPLAGRAITFGLRTAF